MALSQDEIKRRIHAARLIRGMSQARLNELGAADGYGKEEMGRVERGDLEFRPGKHLEPLTRYLDVPEWWFTAERIDFDQQPTNAVAEEVRRLLSEQSVILQEIREATTANNAAAELSRESWEAVRRSAEEARLASLARTEALAAELRSQPAEEEVESSGPRRTTGA